MASHLAVILEAIQKQYSKSDSILPLPVMSLRDQLVPLFWDGIRCLAEAGTWIDGIIIDWLLLCSDTTNTIDFVPTSCPLYAESISNTWTSKKDQSRSEEALTLRLVELLSPGKKEKHSILIKAAATTIVFPWNPSGVHWVLVVATALPGAARVVQVYDTYDARGQRHQATWRHTSVFPLFLVLLGLYHPVFHGVWPSTVTQGRTVRQRGDDCGVFTVWTARHLLSGSNIPDTTNALGLADVLRTRYVGAIRSAIEGTPVDEWDAALDTQYQAMVRPRLESKTPSKSSGAALDADHAAASSDSEDDDESRDSDAAGAAASETKEESDEEANVWLDELDQLLQHYSNCQSWKDVYLAILRNFPEGLSPRQLRFIISQRAKAVHLKPRLKHTKPTWLSLKATNQKYFMRIDHEGKAVLPLSLKDNAPIPKLNTRQAYDVPEQAQALFGDPTCSRCV
jgi:hypothetical protein